MISNSLKRTINSVLFDEHQCFFTNSNVETKFKELLDIVNNIKIEFNNIENDTDLLTALSHYGQCFVLILHRLNYEHVIKKKKNQMFHLLNEINIYR